MPKCSWFCVWNQIRYGGHNNEDPRLIFCWRIVILPALWGHGDDLWENSSPDLVFSL